jgi:hypothetical protein
MIAGNYGQANSVYVNDGTGTFTDSGQSLGSYRTTSIALGDIDSDQDLDLVVGNDNGEANRVYLNDGSGTFTDSGQSLGSYHTSSIALGDVDGDGDLDLIAGNRNNQADRVYLNDGNGVFSDSGQALGPSETHSIALADIDNDGDLDLVAGNANQANKIYVNDGGGNFADTGWDLGSYNTRGVAVGDLDDDGDLDIVEANQQANRVYLNNAAKLFNPNDTPSPPAQLISSPNGSSVTLIWSFGSDEETSTMLLSYNLRVGTTSGGNEVFSGVIPAGLGNVGHMTFHAVKDLPPGTYYWSIQTIDTGFRRSSWGTEDSFRVEHIYIYLPLVMKNYTP